MLGTQVQKTLTELAAAFLKAGSFEDTTRRDYAVRLREFQEFLRGRGEDAEDINNLTLDNAIRFRELLAYRSSRVAGHGTAVLKSFATWCAREGYRRDPISNKSVLLAIESGAQPKAVHHEYSDEQLDAIWAVLSESASRDHLRAIAFVRLVYDTGLGKTDCRKILRRNFNAKTRWLTLAPSKRGRPGRRNTKIRRIRLSRVCAEAIETYLSSSEREPYVGPQPEPLFTKNARGGLSQYGFNTAVDRIASEIERLTGFHWNTLVMQHTYQVHKQSGIRDAELRRRCASLLAEDGQHDRAVVIATQTLEDRVRKKMGATARGPLMRSAFVPDENAPPGTPARLQLATVEQEQTGAYNLFRGVADFYRNGTHHRNRPDDFDPDEARRVVQLIDHMLDLIE
jgi:uncharacterized protein (TIGR02391 family)